MTTAYATCSWIMQAGNGTADEVVLGLAGLEVLLVKRLPPKDTMAARELLSPGYLSGLIPPTRQRYSLDIPGSTNGLGDSAVERGDSGWPSGNSLQALARRYGPNASCVVTLQPGDVLPVRRGTLFAVRCVGFLG